MPLLFANTNQIESQSRDTSPSVTKDITAERRERQVVVTQQYPLGGHPSRMGHTACVFNTHHHTYLTSPIDNTIQFGRIP